VGLEGARGRGRWPPSACPVVAPQLCVPKLDPRGACNQRSLGAAGTPEEASAWRWLQVQRYAVRRMSGLVVGEEPEEGVPGRDPDAGRLSALLASLPALMSISAMDLRADLHRRPSAPAVRAFLAGAARAIARCSCLWHLSLYITLLGGLADQLPEALTRELASVRFLEELTLSFAARGAARPDWPATFSLARVVADLARLSRLRGLSLTVRNVSMEATLPACVSRLTQLTSLSLHGFDGLRCEPGWARLPALVRLRLEACVFACDGEAALPRMDTLVSLTSLDIMVCPGLRLLPASLWRGSQLRRLMHWTRKWDLTGAPRGALPLAGLHAGGAPCFASLAHLNLMGHNLATFPPAILTATRMTHLDLSYCCFEHLPEGVTVLTALTELQSGRHFVRGEGEIGGALDARALGSLAGFPHLRHLSFNNCSMLVGSDFQAAAAHPCLGWLVLRASYPALGPSCGAFLGFVLALLQQRRPDVLGMFDSIITGAGRQDSLCFRAALRAVGYPLHDEDVLDLL